MDGGIEHCFKKKIFMCNSILVIHASRSEFIGGLKAKMPYLIV
jgi:hypothetical protein